MCPSPKSRKTTLAKCCYTCYYRSHMATYTKSMQITFLCLLDDVPVDTWDVYCPSLNAPIVSAGSVCKDFKSDPGLVTVLKKEGLQ